MNPQWFVYINLYQRCLIPARCARSVPTVPSLAGDLTETRSHRQTLGLAGTPHTAKKGHRLPDGVRTNKVFMEVPRFATHLLYVIRCCHMLPQFVMCCRRGRILDALSRGRLDACAGRVAARMDGYVRRGVCLFAWTHGKTDGQISERDKWGQH